jgi:predicted nucleic acid-binding protein
VVNYWDASALVALLARGPAAPRYRAVARESRIVTWWGTFVECASAIARRAREGSAPSQVAESYRMLEHLAQEWLEIEPSEQLRRAATRALKLHTLCAGDALHIGAAMLASHFEPAVLRFLTEDAQLKQAAEHEGFIVL